MRQNSQPLTAHHFDGVDEAFSEAIAKATATLALSAIGSAAPGCGLRINLSGGLGAGKTTWVRAFLRACGIEGRIKSPSFSVVETYEQNHLLFHHLDFYRQSNPNAWQAGGLRDLLAQQAVALMEWPEKAAGLPPPHIAITIGWTGQAEAMAPRSFEIRFFDRNDGIDLEPYLAVWAQQVQQAEHCR